MNFYTIFFRETNISFFTEERRNVKIDRANSLLASSPMIRGSKWTNERVKQTER